ncbi:protein unc-13 homolog C-like [Hydra vulgaris]|uniref:protein unc-13 homolog C-like n=1 Tax=Hydra vulgaris TaxID=6087 RepID=UPI0032EA25BE
MFKEMFCEFKKEMFNEFKKETEAMFKKHEQTVLDIISGNLKILNERLDKLETNAKENIIKIKKVEKEIEEISDSINFNESIIDKKIEYNSKQLEKELIENEILKEKHRKLENRSRRNNLRIDGLYEDEKETWGQTEEKVYLFFKQKLGVEDIEIERAHRTGQKKNGKPRTIVLNLQRYEDKVKILKELHRIKGTNIFVNEDFSLETVAIRKKLFTDVKQRRLNGENVAVRYDKIICFKNSFYDNSRKK